MWRDGDIMWYILGLPLLMLGRARKQQKQVFSMREDKLGPRVTTTQIMPSLARTQPGSMWIGCAASTNSPREGKVMLRSAVCPGSPVRSITRQNWRQYYNIDLRSVRETGYKLPTTQTEDPAGKQCQRQGWALKYLQHNWSKDWRPWQGKIYQVPPDQGSKSDMSRVEIASLLSSKLQRSSAGLLQVHPVSPCCFICIPLSSPSHPTSFFLFPTPIPSQISHTGEVLFHCPSCCSFWCSSYRCFNSFYFSRQFHFVTIPLLLLTYVFHFCHYSYYYLVNVAAGQGLSAAYILLTLCYL